MVKCHNCQAQNPPGSRFCMNCGASLVQACPYCSTVNPLGAKFCMNCGKPLQGSDSTGYGTEQSPVLSPMMQNGVNLPQEYAEKMEAARLQRSMEGERRIVTILFCDVKGSTSMAEGMDPEEWAAIMNRSFEYLISPVYQYEGTVARLMGDAILAFFGAPIAHEDDPQRAILAGLDILSGIQKFSEELKRQHGLDFNVRIGINTGLVVVGSIGSDLHMEYTAMGDAINLAARMEQTARPGTLQITEETYKLVSPLFDVEPLGGIEVKGKQEPVLAYRVLGKRAGTWRRRGIQGLDSPLVGRKAEFKRLTTCLQDLLEGKGQIVSITGEAGLGKSRLVAELHHWAVDQGWLKDDGSGSLAWYEGRSLSYQKSTPYAPWIDLFTRLLGFNSIDEPAGRSYQRLKQELAETGDHAEEQAPYIAMLMGISIEGPDVDRVQYLTPPQLRARIHQAVIDFFLAKSSRKSIVLVFEDLHWIDGASLDLIERLLTLTERTPVMVMALYRPSREDRTWQFFEMAQKNYSHRFTSVALEPLDDQHARTLVSNLLQIEDLPEKVRRLILRKAEGNPFFVEEVIRSLLDGRFVVREGDHWRATRDIDNIAVPDTLSEVITARLDRLDEESRHVTQEAAVVGREFGYDVLGTIHEPLPSQAVSLDDSLMTLQSRELVREKSTHPPRLYSFKHVLTQETAYASLLMSKRRRLHLRIAEYLEKSLPDQTGVIARHFIEARQTRRALPYLIEAGERAARTYATPEAIADYRQALEFVSEGDAEPARRAYEGLGRALSLANQVPEAIDVYQNMYTRGQEYKNIPMQVSAMNKLSDIYAMRMGELTKADQMLTVAENLAHQSDDKPGLAEMFIIRCGLCTATGDFPRALNYLEKSVQIARDLDQKAYMATGLVHIANVQACLLEFERAWETAQESLKISREIGNLESESEVLGQVIPVCYMRAGNFEAAYTAAEQAARTARRIGAVSPQSTAAYYAGLISREMGDYEKAITWEEESIQAGKVFGAPYLILAGFCTLGAIYADINKDRFREQINAVQREGIQLIGQPTSVITAGGAWVDLGFTALVLDNLAEAAEYFNKGLSNPTPLKMILRPYYLVGLALVAIRNGNLTAAEEYLNEAGRYIEEKGLQNNVPLVDLARGRFHLTANQPEKALESFQRAESTSLGMHLRPITWQARSGSAQAFEQMSRFADAVEHREKAQEMIAEIAGLFKTEAYRQAFLENVHNRLVI
ncbi:MAG: adenylate/guanylate cyclase domain-containing protein [Omnitrophica WOR_2 bacterium]